MSSVCTSEQIFFTELAHFAVIFRIERDIASHLQARQHSDAHRATSCTSKLRHRRTFQ